MATGKSTEADSQDDSSPDMALLCELRQGAGHQRSSAAKKLGRNSVATSVILAGLLDARICDTDITVRSAAREALAMLGWKVSGDGRKEIDEAPPAERIAFLESYLVELGQEGGLARSLERCLAGPLAYPAARRLLEVAESDEQAANILFNDYLYGRVVADLANQEPTWTYKALAKLHATHASVRDLVATASAVEDLYSHFGYLGRQKRALLFQARIQRDAMATEAPPPGSPKEPFVTRGEWRLEKSASTEAILPSESSSIASLLFELRHEPGNRRALAALELGIRGVASALVLSRLIEARICDGDQRVRAAAEDALHALGWKASGTGWNDLDQLPHADRLIVLERCWSELGLDYDIPQLLERLFDEGGRRFARFRWPAGQRLLALAETDERLALKMATLILNNHHCFGSGLYSTDPQRFDALARLYDVHRSVRDLITTAAASGDNGTFPSPWLGATTFLAATQNDQASIAAILGILTETDRQGRMEIGWIPELRLCAEACVIVLGRQGACGPAVISALTDLVGRGRHGSTGVAAILALGCTGEAAAIAPVLRALGRAGDYRLAAFRALDRLSTISDFDLELWLEVGDHQGDPASKGGGLLAQIHYGRMTPGFLLSALRWGCWDERRPARSRAGVAETTEKVVGITPTVRRISRELVLPLPLVARAWEYAKEEARLRRIFGEHLRPVKHRTKTLEVKETRTLPKPTMAEDLASRLQADIRFVVRMAAYETLLRTAAGREALSHAAAYDRSARVRAAIRAAAQAKLARRRAGSEEPVQGQQDSTWPEPPEDYWDLVAPRHEFKYDELLDRM